MKTAIKKQNYLEGKREAILNMGYGYVRFRSRARKSIRTLKGIIQNNTRHFEGVYD